MWGIGAAGKSGWEYPPEIRLSLNVKSCKLGKGNIRVMIDSKLNAKERTAMRAVLRVAFESGRQVAPGDFNKAIVSREFEELYFRFLKMAEDGISPEVA